MKTLKQIREENRKFIIMACNPGAKTYEEALEMDQEDLRTTLSDNCEIDDSECFDDLVEVLYKPLTLNRVLLALPVKDYEGFIIDNHGRLYDSYISTPYNGCKLTADGDYKFLWNYRKKTLEEQSEKTQRAVHKLNNK